MPHHLLRPQEHTFTFTFFLNCSTWGVDDLGEKQVLLNDCNSVRFISGACVYLYARQAFWYTLYVFFSPWY